MPKARHKIGRFLIRKVRLNSSLTSLAETLEDRRTNLARLQSLVNASPVAMYACRAEGDFTTTFVTEGVRTLWGYEPSDFLRDPRFWTEHLHPEDAPRVLRQLTNVVEQGRHSYDYRFRVKSGEYRWTHDDMRLVRDRAGNPVEIAGYCFDITEQKLAEAALRESEERQKIIFNSTSDLQGLFRMEPGNVFVTEAMNRAMAENLRSRMGKNAADFLGKDFSELLAATGMSTEEIESRRSLYRQAAEERTTVRWDSPPSALRDPRGLRLSGDGPAGKLHPHPVEWAQRLQALQG